MPQGDSGDHFRTGSSRGSRAPSGAASSGPQGVIALLAAASLGAGALVTLGATAGLASLKAGLWPAYGAGYALALALCVLASAVALRAALLVAPRRGGNPSRLRASHARASLIVFVLATLAHLVWLQPFRLHVALATVALAGGLHGAVALRIARPGTSRRVTRGLELALFSGALMLLGLELGLREFSRHRPLPLLAGVDSDARYVLDAHRLSPGLLRYGFPLDSRGNYDHEWGGRAPGQLLVTCIGDSFSQGSVPFPLHYTSVAERLLDDVEIYNIGAPAIGPHEYLVLLQEQALPMQPDLAIVALFVGNDLELLDPEVPDAMRLRIVLDAERVLLARLAKRLLARRAERQQRGGAPIGTVQGESDSMAHIDTVDEAERAFPFTVDPSLEEPTFSIRSFETIQRHRVRLCRTDGPSFEGAERALARMVAAAGTVPLAILLIPDEFQIEDEQWAAMTALHPGAQFERFRPQRWAAEWCAANGVELIDTTHALLEAPLYGGRRAVYHLRDTHWNARGNRIAGEVLAGYLRERLPRERR